MGRDLWFTRVVDIGNSDGGDGRPVSPLIDYTMRATFALTDAAINRLRLQPWVEQVNRRGDRGCALQLIVRCRELPNQFLRPDSLGAFQAEIRRLVAQG